MSSMVTSTAPAPAPLKSPELLAAAAVVPTSVDSTGLPPSESILERKAGRSNTSSTCSTASGDAESEMSSDDEDLKVAGQVWELSQDPLGCRRVQQAWEQATSEEERCALAKELYGHELQAMQCPHGNHVLQKCINTMQPESLQFIIDALTQEEGMVVQVAKHRYGCRILQHLLKACPPSQMSKIAESLLEEASALACHNTGNYAVQYLMKFGSEEHRYRLARCIEQNVASICRSVVGGTVIETAITHAAPEDKVWTARAVAQDPELLLALAKARLGHSCALLVLETLPVREERRASAALTQHLEELKGSRFGLKMVQKLESTR